MPAPIEARCAFGKLVERTRDAILAGGLASAASLVGEMRVPITKYFSILTRPTIGLNSPPVTRDPSRTKVKPHGQVHQGFFPRVPREGRLFGQPP
ncbi:MAG: hypothetical protein Q6373_013420 [Candidatus Sigynarchaeota archaeon]